MKTVYISGPMTGLPELNFPAFHAAAKALRAMGFDVANPAELNSDPAATWHQCMRIDIKALCDCDGLVLLPGWEDSKGAHEELNLAHRLGMKVRTLDKLLDEKGLRAAWDQLALGGTATAALPASPRLGSLEFSVAVLRDYYRAEMETARKRVASCSKTHDVQGKLRAQAVARAWGKALRELDLLTFKI